MYKHVKMSILPTYANEEKRSQDMYWKWVTRYLGTGHSVQGPRKMKKVRGALRALKAQVLLGSPGTRPQKFVSIFSMLKHVFLRF